MAVLSHDVQQLHHEIEPKLFKPYNKESMKALFETIVNKESVEAVVVTLDGIPAGYMILDTVIRQETALKFSYSILHIEQICVHESFVGNGLGKVLVDYAKDKAKSENIDRIEMSFWTKNNNSGEFFGSQGFENFVERMVFIV